MKTGINLKKAEKELAKTFKEKGLKVRISQDDGCLNVVGSFGVKPYDDEIFTLFEYYEKGAAVFTFTFDHLEINEQTLRMVNEFNEKNKFFRAFIDSNKKYLRIQHPLFHLDAAAVVPYTLAVLNYLADKELQPILGPLCLLSEGDAD